MTIIESVTEGRLLLRAVLISRSSICCGNSVCKRFPAVFIYSEPFDTLVPEVFASKAIIFLHHKHETVTPLFENGG